jgi:hypothetical protein
MTESLVNTGFRVETAKGLWFIFFKMSSFSLSHKVNLHEYEENPALAPRFRDHTM